MINIRQKFASDGQVTFYRAVPDHQANAWRTMARHARGWFSEVLDGVVEDNGRVKAPVPDEEARNISNTLQRFNKTFIPESEANDWNWFKLRAGWRDLPVRRDFDPVRPDDNDPLDVAAIPNGMIVALDDEVRFYVYGWNPTVALHSNRKEITSRQGDIFVYRGDLIFGLVGSETNSVCLHAFLDTPTSDRSPDHQPVIVPALDDTVPSDDPLCFAWNCTFRGSGTLEVRRHLNRFHGFRFHNGAPVEA